MFKKSFGILMVILCTLGLAGHSLAANDLLNPGFETWTAGPNAPPDNWALSHDDTTVFAAQESDTVRSGSYSVALTCSTTYTRWLEQTASVTPESCYQFSCYAWDTDSVGRARVAIRWFDATDTNNISGYYGDYSSDQAAWQLLSTGAQKAPAGAAYAHCEIRIYEENYDSLTWTHARLMFDDAEFDTITCPTAFDTLSIPEIQFNNTIPGSGNDCYNSPENGNVVVTTGIVTAVQGRTYPDTYWLQDADSAWSGIYVFDFPSPVFQVGDMVRIRAEVDEYYGMTEMTNVDDYVVLSHGNKTDTLEIVPSDLSGGCNAHGEQFEGQLCILTDVVCVSGPDPTSQWYVKSITGGDSCQIDDNIYQHLPAVGDTFISITGVVDYSYEEYGMRPRFSTDIIPKTYPGPDITGISWTPTLPTENDVTVMASIYDTASTVQNERVYYQLNATTGLWSSVVSTSSDNNYYYFTIPGQDPEQVVYFYVYAENDTGVSSSSIKQYTTTEDDPNVRINEFMYDSPSTDAGCFIELKGPPGTYTETWELIMVNGFDGTDKKIIDLTGFTIDGDGFYVIAQDATVPNYDMINSLANFENGPDNIHLRRNGFLIDAVGYGSFAPQEYFMGETWPTYDPGLPYGFSLCRYPDGADTDYNRRDFGIYGSASNTPGAANAAPTEYTIRQIQEPVAKTDSPHNTERVIVGGIVTVDTACTYNPGYYIEMSSGGGWSGVLVYDLFYEPTRGDSVKVRGTVTEEFGRTQISYVTTYSNYGPGNMPSALVVPTAAVAVAESLEGVLVQVEHVTVTDTLGYGEFLVSDGAADDTCRVDDICGYATEVTPGDQFDAIRGVVDYAFGLFRIQPRDDSDFMNLNLTATKSAGDIHLEWISLVGADNYVVYRSTHPESTSDSLGTVASPGTTYLDVGAAGNTVTNYYYLVQARSAGSKLVDSGEVGELDKDLQNVK